MKRKMRFLLVFDVILVFIPFKKERALFLDSSSLIVSQIYVYVINLTTLSLY